ncbi:hypothetical protein CEXT_111421 [Caerostris extrusa]|uniref:Uncharacterized protein n=1 Tax=Caerostris extrusa TaxID=172846 RepID=A0AAV4SDA5_CAEEX|nr:hypothetical protein CEXT_111421 [Caerostris extrusa]
MDENSFKLCEARKSGKSSRQTVKSLLPLWDRRPAETTRRLIPHLRRPLSNSPDELVNGRRRPKMKFIWYLAWMRSDGVVSTVALLCEQERIVWFLFGRPCISANAHIDFEENEVTIVDKERYRPLRIESAFSAENEILLIHSDFRIEICFPKRELIRLECR